jgi:sugar lactone lactonase YvrE
MAKPEAVKVTTLAGGKDAGFADGVGADAKFASPRDVAIDASSNCYVADTGNHAIRKITSDGKVTTLAGFEEGYMDGEVEKACFSKPEGLALGPNGDLYVTDSGNNRIRKINFHKQSAMVTTVAGCGSEGYVDKSGTNAKFHYPTKLAVDMSGYIFVADTCNGCVRKISFEGIVSTVATIDSITEGLTPAGVVQDSNGNVYVSDSGNSRICMLKALDGWLSVITLSGSKKYDFNDEMEEITCVDGVGSKARFAAPHGLAVGPDGNIYVADYWNHRIRVISTKDEKPKVSTLAGGEEGFADGNAKTAKFSYPKGVAVDPLGNVYVADTYNSRIRKIFVPQSS